MGLGSPGSRWVWALVLTTACRGEAESATTTTTTRASDTSLASPDPLTPLDEVVVDADEVVEVQGSKMVLDPDDRIVSRVIRRDKIWEPLETDLFSRALEPGDVVIDVGANIGYYTLLAARRVGPTGHVYAFEPEPRAFAILQRNVALNGYTNVTLVAKALGRSPGTLRLYLAKRNRGDHRVYDPTGKREAIDVEVVTLDEVLAAEPPARIDLIKIDTQGAECSILAGAEQTLADHREATILMEFTPNALVAVGDSPRGCLERLTGSGFALFDVDEWQREVSPTDVETLLREYPEDDPKRFTNLLLPARSGTADGAEVPSAVPP